MTDADLLSPPEFTHTRAPTPDGQKPSARAADALRVGGWIDLVEHGKTQRCQLTWTSPNGRIFMFTASEGHTVSCSRYGLERLQGAGLLRLVAWHATTANPTDTKATGIGLCAAGRCCYAACTARLGGAGQGSRNKVWRMWAAGVHAAGNRRQKRVCSVVEANDTVPPCASMMARVIARPKPVPSGLRCARDLSTR